MKKRSASRNPLDSEFARSLPSQELSILLQVSSTLAASLDIDQVLQKAIKSAVSLLELETGAIYTLKDSMLYLGATTPPLPVSFPEELRQANLSNHPHIREAVKSGQTVYLRDAEHAALSAAEKAVVEGRHLKSVLYVPLFLEGQPTGVLIVGSTSAVRELNAHQIELARTLSFQIALAIANAYLFQSLRSANQELKDAYDATLEGWSLALEMRDQATEGHTRRVAETTLLLAQRIGIAAAELEPLRRGALLHDIGKMSIPDAILHKPGRLNKAEWAIMRMHPELAYKMLRRIDHLLPALDIPYCHHEKWDGSGYPRGLRGEQIPLAARIFAVVDVFDALTSDRPYRKAWSSKRALRYLCDQTGLHFDPDIVAAFMEHVQHQCSVHKS